METTTQDASGYYVWQAEGKGFEIHIHLEVIDALLPEIMRGFGAVPKRGAEVGGVLLGSIERGDATVVRIQDFEPVACGYTRGPSYLLSPKERETFEETCARWHTEATPASQDSPLPESATADSSIYAVGYYRSHTRDGMSLSPEDIELLERCFPGPADVALLVKPFATKASPAGFFFREDGAFQKTTLLEFRFRRRELTGEEAPGHRPLTDRGTRAIRELVRLPKASVAEVAVPETTGAGYFANSPVADYQIPKLPRSRLGSWMFFPLSFIFLLLGLALGVALNIGPRGGTPSAADYSLATEVLKTGDTLSLRWNGESPLIRKAERGVLEIHDGDYAKVMDLDATYLRTGNIGFQPKSDMVTFRLTVYLNSKLSVSENLQWSQ